jgi:hypothetical protein
MKKKIFSMLVLLMTAVTGAWAQEQSETIATTDMIVEGTHFTISNNYSWADEYGMCADGGITVTPKNGEIITKVVISCTYMPDKVNDGNTSVSSGTKEITNGGGTITVTGVNASTFTFTCSDAGPQFGPFVVYYTEASAPAADPDYYLVGTMNDWGASKQFLLTPNPGNAAEYMITLNLKAGTELKVIGVDAQNNATWYPSGDNYYVNTAGQYTVYFRPDGSGTGEGWHHGCIYLDPAPAPAVPLTDLGSGQWQFQMPSYAVVAKIEYDTELELQEENVNTAVLADWHGYEADITLQRTLKAGSWNTLAVPFNVSSQMLSYLTSTYGMQVKQLASTSLENEGKTLMLNFTDATEMVAGTPYLVKVSTDYDFSARALPNTEVSQELNPVQTDYADFIPTLGKTTIEGVDADDVLFVAAGNKLKIPNQMPTDMKGFRAYFQLKNVPAAARAFALNLGDESTGIESLTASPMGEGSIYDLQGRKANAAQKGVYIVNGKKVIK